MNQIYFEFIDSCRTKFPEKFHKHHIVPRYLGGSNDPENLIKLSYEDHFQAHILLAESFEEDSDDYNRNMWAASWLKIWINDSNKIDISEKLSKIRKGKTYEELFGIDVSERAKEKMSIKHSIWWNNLSPNDYENFILKLSKGQKRYWSNVSDEDKKNKGEKLGKIKKLWWDNITYEELLKWKMQRSSISKKWWNNLSEEELLELKNKWSVSTKKWFENASEEKLKSRGDKISKSQKGKKIKPETTEKWRKTVEENGSLIGEKNPMFGKHHSDETKKVLREKRKGISTEMKPRASFTFFKDGILVYEAIGQTDAHNFCKEQNISFQTLCKKSDRWKNWYCKRNKK
jgi:hypothetical protein